MSPFNEPGHLLTVPDILKLDPVSGIALTQMTERVMRGPSPLAAGERELIAAYVSGLNRCAYCYGVHSACARAYGYAQAIMEVWLDDLQACPLEPKIRVLLNLAGLLTRDPAGIDDALKGAVYAAGWNARTVHDVIAVTSLFNLYNRLLEGHQVQGDQALYEERGPMLKQYGYAPIIKMLERERDKTG